MKVKKGTGYVFYMATPSHATESVVWTGTLVAPYKCEGLFESINKVPYLT